MENPSGTSLLNPHKKLLLRQQSTNREKETVICWISRRCQNRAATVTCIQATWANWPCEGFAADRIRRKDTGVKDRMSRCLAIDTIQTKFPEITSVAICIRRTKSNRVTRCLWCRENSWRFTSDFAFLPSKSWRPFPTLCLRFYFWTFYRL